MFVLMIEHNCRNFLIQCFLIVGKSNDTHFRASLHPLVAFWKEMIKPSPFEEMPPEKMKYIKYYP